MPAQIKVAAVQMDVTLGEKDKNLARILESLEETAREGALLTVFPECALTGYCFESANEARPLAEPIPGPSTRRLAAACRELKAFAVVGLIEADGSRFFNACALVGPDGVAAKHRKIHLPFLGLDQLANGLRADRVLRRQQPRAREPCLLRDRESGRHRARLPFHRRLAGLPPGRAHAGGGAG